MRATFGLLPSHQIASLQVIVRDTRVGQLVSGFQRELERLCNVTSISICESSSSVSGGEHGVATKVLGPSSSLALSLHQLDKTLLGKQLEQQQKKQQSLNKALEQLTKRMSSSNYTSSTPAAMQEVDKTRKHELESELHEFSKSIAVLQAVVLSGPSSHTVA